MQPSKHDAAFLWDMLRHAREVSGFVAGRSFQDFLTDTMLRRATERSVLVVGEAARHVSEEFRAATPAIPWLAIVTQRHRLVHEYGEIDPERIWRVAIEHVPRLVIQLEALLPEAPPDPAPER